VTYGDPKAMLEEALDGLSDAARAKFEADFQHFASYSGLPLDHNGNGGPVGFWAKWAFWSAGDYNGTTS
jgi:hypothetical protein